MQYLSHIRHLNAYDRHKKFMRDYGFASIQYLKREEYVRRLVKFAISLELLSIQLKGWWRLSASTSMLSSIITGPSSYIDKMPCGLHPLAKIIPRDKISGGILVTSPMICMGIFSPITAQSLAKEVPRQSLRRREEKLRDMASVSMMASLVGGAAAVAQPMNRRRTLVVAKAAARVESQDIATVNKEEKESSRRAAMLAVAAAAVTAVAGSAFAEDEPKRGSPEAKKKYAPICVTMPTARVCNSVA